MRKTPPPILQTLSSFSLRNRTPTSPAPLHLSPHRAAAPPRHHLPHATPPLPNPTRSPQFSTLTQTILVRARDPSEVAAQITAAVDEGRLEDAWSLYEQYSIADGLPRRSVLGKLIVGLAESFDPRYLPRAFQIIESVVERKKNELLEKEHLLYLSLILARCGLPVPASTVLRRLVEMEEYPNVAVWTVVAGYMVRTASGAVLAAELVGEFGYLFKDNRVDPRKKSNRGLLSMKPNGDAFNIALSGCLVFGFSKKAVQLLELMPRVRVKADADMLITMAHVYERNGHLDEIKKLRRYAIENADVGVLQLQQFYECLLSCHLKLNELELASGIVLDMLRKAKEAKSSLAAAKSVLRIVEGCQIPGDTMPNSLQNFRWIMGDPPSFREFCKDKNINASRLAGETRELLLDLRTKLHGQVELVRSVYGILHPTEKVYARLVSAFLEAGRITELAGFLIKVQKEEAPLSNENSLLIQVINACISLQNLDQAHDLLDEMRFNGIGVGSSVYSDLLKAYCKAKRFGEVTALLKDARKAGVQLDSSCYEALIKSQSHQDISGALRLFSEMKDSGILSSIHCELEKEAEGCAGNKEADSTTRLLEEIKGAKRVDHCVHEWNNVIHFFCKKGLMHDAQKTLKKMRELGHSPNSQTFYSLVTGYADMGGKYLEVAELWGEMKVLANTSLLKFDQELLDSLLYCFIRGGLFLRANEVVMAMEKADMFIDKFKYRKLWLKYHRSLYKTKAPKIQTEAQLERREAAVYFKRWLNLT